MELKVSHVLREVGFSGTTEVRLGSPVQVDDLGFFGAKGAALVLKAADAGKYDLEITSPRDLADKEVFSLVEKIGHHFSFLLAQDEPNPAYNTPYMDVLWEQLVASHAPGNVGVLSSSLGVNVGRPPVAPDPKSFREGQYTDLLGFFYDGLRAEYYKSKYVHWFLVLESLEYSTRYKRQFESSRLFGQGDQRAIREIADTLSDSVKRSALLNVLTRTASPRPAKLVQVLKDIGISSYWFAEQETPISEGIVRSLIESRNYVVHTSSEFDKTLLWAHLFPIARAVVKRAMEDPQLLA